MFNLAKVFYVFFINVLVIIFIFYLLNLKSIHYFLKNHKVRAEGHQQGGPNGRIRWPKATSPIQEMEGGLRRGPNLLVPNICPEAH